MMNDMYSESKNLLDDDTYSENKTDDDDTKLKDNEEIGLDSDSDDDEDNIDIIPNEIAPYPLWETQIKEIIIDIFTKNYPFLFFCFMFGLSIGFIVYIFTAKKWYMTILSIGFVIVGVLYDEYHFKDKRKKEGNPLHWEFNINVDDGTNANWQRSNDDEFYVLSRLYSRVTGKPRGATRIYKKANTHALTIQTLFENEEYGGFEIGGGVAYIVGIIVFGLAFSRADLPTAILDVYFSLILAGLLGCVIGMYLRKWAWLGPSKYRQSRTQSFALHEVTHVEIYTVGFHKAFKRLRQTSWFFEIISWFFYAVSFILLLPVFIVQYIIKFVYLYPIFLLWVFHFLGTMILFEIQRIKQRELLKVLVWLLPFNFLYSLYCLYLFAPYKPEYTCNARCGCKLKQILYTRVPANAQKLLLILLGVCSFLIFATAVFIITVQIRIHGKSGNPSVFSDYNYDVYNTLICKETHNSKWIFDVYPNTYNNSYNADNIYTVNDVSDAGLELCDTTNFELLSLSLLILSIVWYILLGGWLYMWQNDTIGFKKKNIATNTWLTHTTVSISLKSHKWYSNAIDIPLTYETAQKLHDFIVSNGAWYNQERNISNGSM